MGRKANDPIAMDCRIAGLPDRDNTTVGCIAFDEKM
jgi:hypothetical protein